MKQVKMKQPSVRAIGWERTLLGRVVGVLFVAGMSAAATGEQETGQAAPRRFEFTQIEMAVTVKIVLYSPDADTATAAAKDAFSRVHTLNGILSDYDPESELRQLCDTAGEGKAVHVSLELWKVLEHAQHVSQQSDGAFDVTVGPIVRLWRRARRQKELPSAQALHEAQELVGYKFVKLDARRQTVELLKKGMRIDLGGIAKGYAMDEALAVLQRRGIMRALVGAGGDMRLGDPPPGRSGWRVAIPPLDNPQGEPASYLELSRVAVSTSGDMIQYVEIAGKRYSHVVDPRTGMALTDHCRVMVVGRTGMAADAITKAVGVLGPAKGLKLIDETPGMAAMVTRAPNGRIEHYESSRWKELPQVRLKGEE
ncbi:MAG: FAD:protein FMN transferase [Thermoguttaceae bacterium]